jgi:hypothetical protein
MATPFRAASARTFKRRNWLYVPAGGLADYFAPTATELTAASVVDFTRMAFRDGTGQPTQTTARVEAQQRLGDDRQFENKGTTTVQGGTLQWGLDPQAPAASDGKKLWELWKEGDDGGFLVRRLNIARDTNIIAGQFVTVYPADIGPSFEVEVGDGESAEVGGVCDYFIRDEIAQGVAVVAGV